LCTWHTSPTTYERQFLGVAPQEGQVDRLQLLRPAL
jgi:hypothetical protein